MKPKYIYYLLISLLSFGFTAASKDLPKQPHVVLSEEVLELSKQETPYKEYLSLQETPTNWLERLKDWFFSLFSSHISRPLLEDVVIIALYMVAIIAIVLIVMKLSGLSLTSLYKPNSKDSSTLIPFDEDTPLGSVKFSHLIDQSINENNYRQAIRYTYLSILQTLDNKDYINWEKEKSNFDYLLCIKPTPVYPTFKTITQIYEEAWYGEMPWTDEQYFSQYHIMKEQVQEMNKNMTTT